MLAAQANIVVTGMNLVEPMDGVELISRLRHDDAEVEECDVCLPKLCLPNDLLGVVRRWLRCHAFADGRHTAGLSASVTQIGGARWVCERDAVRHRPPSVRAIPCP